MFRLPPNSLILVLLAGTLCAANPQHRSKQQKPSPQVAAPQAQAPPSQATAAKPAAAPAVTPEHGPSSPPDVSLQQGKLTIVANNSTLGDVLNAVKQKTGAAIDMPSTSTDRVVGQFGPGAPRDVMAQLLNGSHFDYVLVGSPTDPIALKRIVLTAKATGPEPAPQPQPDQQMQQNEPLQAVPEVESENPNPDENAGEASPNVVTPPEEEGQPAEQGDQQQGPPIVKTPEQLLRELQQQQQQQQQQQEQEQPPPGAPGAPPR